MSAKVGLVSLKVSFAEKSKNFDAQGKERRAFKIVWYCSISLPGCLLLEVLKGIKWAEKLAGVLKICISTFLWSSTSGKKI